MKCRHYTGRGATPALNTSLAVEDHAELYWLAFLVTGHPEASVDAVVDALEPEDTGSLYFRNWMVSWARKLVIAKALAAVQADLAVSLQQMYALREPAEASIIPSRGWSLHRSTTKLQLERALLAINVFPRCALLLTVFEKVSLADAAILLSADEEMVRRAKTIGLRELTRNLAVLQHVSETRDNGSNF